jgi:hypothetical protein
MLIKYLFALLFASLLLSGCSTANDSCLSQDAQKLIYKHIIEHSVELTNKKSNQLDNGSSVLSTDKIRSVLNQIHFEMDNVRTIRQNQGNITGVCTGQLEMSIPPPMLGEVDKARDARHLINMSQYARQLNIENNINVFTQKIDYSVKLAGNNKMLAVEIESTPWAHLLEEIIMTVLIKSTVGFQAIDDSGANKQVIEPLKIEVATPIEKTQDTEESSIQVIKPEPIEKEVQSKQVAQKNTTQLMQSKTNTKQISPGFDCSKATKLTDITICAKSDLASLDLENMKIYKNAKIIDSVGTKQIWKESIRLKYACGSDVLCITKAYEKSIQRYRCIIANKKMC